MNTRDKIIEKISDLLDFGIRSEHILMPTNNVLSDAVSVFLETTNLKNTTCYKQPSSPSIEHHIHRRLGHIIVSPKDKYNTNALREVYVYETDHKIVNSHFVNYNFESTEHFVNSIIEKAKTIEKDFSENNPIDLSGRKAASAWTQCFILYGKRGIGKTFYLNHLMSKFTDMFDEKKVLWIRINLINEFTEGDIDLMEWLNTQLAKIIFRYYDPNSRYFKKRVNDLKVDATDALYKYVNDEIRDKELRLILKEDIEIIKKVFQSTWVEPVRKGLVKKLLGRVLQDYLISNGFSIVYVLDGLDRMEPLPNHENKFNKILNALLGILNSGKIPNCFFLIVTRTNNLFTFRSSRQGNQPTFDEIERELKAVSLDKVLIKRLDYIDKEVEKLRSVGWYSDSKDQSILNEWPNFLNDFRSFLWMDNLTFDEYYKSLKQIYDQNRRAQMQTVQCNYSEFLQKKMKRHYILTESLIRAGRIFPPKPYNYILNDGKIVRQLGDNIFDNHFLPNIFCFPYLVDKKNNNTYLYKSKHLLLAGMRCIQLVDAHCERMQVAQSKIDPLKSKELSKILNKLFNYPEDIIIMLIEEFAEYELFFVGGVGVDAPPDSKNYTPKPMPKMKYIKDNMFNDIAYLNLCSLRIPMNKEILNDSNMPFLKAINSEKSNIDEWVTIKIINAISMIKLIVHINNKENQLYQNNINKLEKRYIETTRKAELDGMFNVFNKESVMKQIGKILSSHALNLDYTLEKIEKYINRWGLI